MVPVEAQYACLMYYFPYFNFSQFKGVPTYVQSLCSYACFKFYFSTGENLHVLTRVWSLLHIQGHQLHGMQSSIAVCAHSFVCTIC
jgi:hypothetical protein